MKSVNPEIPGSSKKNPFLSGIVLLITKSHINVIRAAKVGLKEDKSTMIENNATLANEICKLCVAQPTRIIPPPWITDNVVYAGGQNIVLPGTIPLNNTWIIAAFAGICIFIMLICVGFVHLHNLKKKEP